VGLVPEDPEARRVAYDLAIFALAERQRRRSALSLAGALLLAAGVHLAAVASPWWWLSGAFCAGLLVYGWFVLPARLERRAELLRPPEG
jgi:hypothetical protein